MADDIAPVVPVPSPETAPTVVAPAPAPTTVAEPAPVVAPAPAPEAEPVSLLTKAADPAPVAEPEAEAPKPVEPETPPPVEAEVELPKYEFKLPEGITGDTAVFSEALGKFQNLAKADPEATAAFGQQMIDLHLAEVTNAVTKYQKDAIDFVKEERSKWVEAFRQDPEIGGSRQDTSLALAGQAIRQFGGNADQQTELFKTFDELGVGNHPAIIRMLVNAGKFLSEGKPVPAVKPVVAQSKLDRRYGGT